MINYYILDIFYPDQGLFSLACRECWPIKYQLVAALYLMRISILTVDLHFRARVLILLLILLRLRPISIRHKICYIWVIWHIHRFLRVVCQSVRIRVDHTHLTLNWCKGVYMVQRRELVDACWSFKGRLVPLWRIK